MNLSEKALIPDRRLFEAEGVSLEHGRKCLKALEDAGVIKPQRTPTGRCRLSMKDAEILAKAL